MMFITKRHLSRRTFLRGVGASVALPLLDSMVAAQTPLKNTAAAPKTRFAACYVPHGATMDKWTPSSEGTGFAFTEILKPLEPHRDRINVVSGLAHPYVAGAGRSRRVRRRQPHARGRSVSHRVGAGSRCAGAPGGVGRSSRGAAYRPGHATPVAGALHRGSGARLRGDLQLRLSQLHLVEVADTAAADAEQPAAGVREAVRRRFERRRAARAAAGDAKPARFSRWASWRRCRRTCRRPIGDGSTSISRTCARSSAGFSARRPRRARTSRSRMCRRVFQRRLPSTSSC